MVIIPSALITLSCALLNVKLPTESMLNFSAPSVSTKNLPLEPVSDTSAFVLPSNILSAERPVKPEPSPEKEVAVTTPAFPR